MNWYAVLPILVFGGPAAGFLLELAVGLFCRTRRYLLCVPVLVGALGLALCAASPVHTLPFSFLLLCWGLYGGGLLFGWSLSHLLRGGEGLFQRYAVRAVALCSGAALAIGFGVLISHEMRSATYTMVREDISEERVLAEIPELAITETDREILSALRASPSVQAAVAGGEPFIDLPPAEHEDIQSILSEFLDEGRYRFSDAGVLAQSGEATSLYYDIFDQEKNVRIMVTGLGTGYLHKAIAVYDGDPKEELSMVIYENDNGACRKMTEQRMWFYDFYETELG